MTIDKENILTAMVNAHRNAGEASHYSNLEQNAHQAGIRDVAIRLGIYDDLMRRLDEVCSIEGCNKPMLASFDGDHLCLEHANEWLRGERMAAMENDEP